MGLLKQLGQRAATISELLSFLHRRRLWWMLPLVLVLLAFSMILYLATQPPISPFVYTLF